MDQLQPSTKLPLSELCSALSKDMEIWLSLGHPMAQEFKWIPVDPDSVLVCATDLGEVAKPAVSHSALGAEGGGKGGSLNTCGALTLPAKLCPNTLG